MVESVAGLLRRIMWVVVRAGCMTEDGYIVKTGKEVVDAIGCVL